MRSVTTLSVSDSRIWVGTTGGVFSYSVGSGEIRRYTAAEGLAEVSVDAVAFDDARNVLWVGYRSGILDRIDIESGAVRTFREIERAEQFASRGINNIQVQGDSLYIATAFGVVLFDPVAEEVRDSYTDFGSFTSGIPAYDVQMAPLPGGGAGLWVATDEGVARAPMLAGNLKDPDLWTTESVGGGSAAVFALGYHRGHIYAGSTSDLWQRMDGGTYQPLQLSNRVVETIVVEDDRLYASAPFQLITIDAAGNTARYGVDGIERLTGVMVDPAGNIWLGSAREGLAQVMLPAAASQPASVSQAVSPDGPYFNNITGLTVDEGGVLWAAGAAGTHMGFYKFDPAAGWTNYTDLFFEPLVGRPTNYHRIHAAGPPQAWAGSYGAGLVHVRPDGTLEVFDHTNSTLRAPGNLANEAYITVGGVASDSDDRMWVTNIGAAHPLNVRLPDGTWHGLPQQGAPGATYNRITVDTFDQKWIALFERNDFNNGTGLLVLDTRGTPADASDDQTYSWRQAGSAGTGLPGITVNDIEEDRDGRFIWVATSQGPAYIENTGAVALQEQPLLLWPQRIDREAGLNTFLLYGLQVNDIAFDPANRAWLATDAGAYLIQDVEGGFEIAEHFTTDNSPLFSDRVVAVAVDDASGRVYFSTDSGLLSYQGNAVQAAEQVQPLFVYPNPARIGQDAEVNICIEGLVEAMEVRVLTPAGEVVARLEGRGGRICWDGRDAHGQLVASGVYLIAAVADEGTAYGKVAVIR